MSTSARQTTAYFAAFFILGATIASLGPTLKFIEENTGAATASLGLLFTLRSGGYLVGSLLGGRLYDSLPGHRLLGIAILTGAIGLGLIPQISSFTIIIALMLLIGLSEATLDVGSNTQLVWVHGARSGPYLNGMFLFAGIGGTLSPLLLSSVGGTWGYRILALASLPVALWAFFTPSPPRQMHEEDREAGTLSPFLFALFCLLTFIFIGGEVGFSGWIYSYAYELEFGDRTDSRDADLVLLAGNHPRTCGRHLHHRPLQTQPHRARQPDGSGRQPRPDSVQPRLPNLPLDRFSGLRLFPGPGLPDHLCLPGTKDAHHRHGSGSLMGQRQFRRDGLSLGDGAANCEHRPGQHHGHASSQFWSVSGFVWVGFETVNLLTTESKEKI